MLFLIVGLFGSCVVAMEPLTKINVNAILEQGGQNGLPENNTSPLSPLYLNVFFNRGNFESDAFCNRTPLDRQKKWELFQEALKEETVGWRDMLGQFCSDDAPLLEVDINPIEYLLEQALIAIKAGNNAKAVLHSYYPKLEYLLSLIHSKNEKIIESLYALHKPVNKQLFNALVLDAMLEKTVYYAPWTQLLIGSLQKRGKLETYLNEKTPAGSGNFLHTALKLKCQKGFRALLQATAGVFRQKLLAEKDLLGKTPARTILDDDGLSKELLLFQSWTPPFLRLPLDDQKIDKTEAINAFMNAARQTGTEALATLLDNPTTARELCRTFNMPLYVLALAARNIVRGSNVQAIKKDTLEKLVCIFDKLDFFIKEKGVKGGFLVQQAGDQFFLAMKIDESNQKENKSTSKKTNGATKALLTRFFIRTVQKYGVEKAYMKRLWYRGVPIVQAAMCSRYTTALEEIFNTVSSNCQQFLFAGQKNCAGKIVLENDAEVAGLVKRLVAQEKQLTALVAKIKNLFQQGKTEDIAVLLNQTDPKIQEALFFYQIKSLNTGAISTLTQELLDQASDTKTPRVCETLELILRKAEEFQKNGVDGASFQLLQGDKDVCPVCPSIVAAVFADLKNKPLKSNNCFPITTFLMKTGEQLGCLPRLLCEESKTKQNVFHVLTLHKKLQKEPALLSLFLEKIRPQLLGKLLAQKDRFDKAVNLPVNTGPERALLQYTNRLTQQALSKQLQKPKVLDVCFGFEGEL